MFQVIIETIFSTLAEAFAGKAAEKGLAKVGRARGWIALGVLLLIIGLLVWLGIYLIGEGVWYIAVLMFAIAAFLAWITVAAGLKGRRQRKES